MSRSRLKGILSAALLAQLVVGGVFGAPTPSLAIDSVSATASTVTATQSSVPADGVSSTTIAVRAMTAPSLVASSITIELQDSSPTATITPTTATTNILFNSGFVYFTVKDAVPEDVTYTAIDMTHSPNITFVTKATVTFSDVTPPTITNVSPADNTTTTSSSITLTFTATDNSGKPPTCTPVSGSKVPLSFGNNKIDISCSDGAGNVASRSFNVFRSDNLPPTLSNMSPPTGATVFGTVNVSVQATDNDRVSIVRFYYGPTLIGTDTSSPYSVSWSTTSLADNPYTLRAEAADATGNTASTTVNVTVDNPPADILAPIATSVTRASSSPTNAGSVSWSVYFSESVNGVDAGDFALAQSGGVSGASISSVTGTGNVYTVTAFTGSGSGSLGLNLVDNDSIIDGVGNPLAGSNSGNVTGQSYAIDMADPSVSAVSPTTAQTGVSTTFSASVSDASPVTCTFYADSVAMGSGPVASRSHAFSPAGSHSARFNCTDAAGNSIDGPTTTIAVSDPPPPPPPPVDPPPTISGVASVSVTSSGATITWNTDEPASSTADYGTTTAYGVSATGGSGTTHSVVLSGLNPSTLYHFRVRSADSGGNEAMSGDFTFTTSAAVVTLAPTLSFSSDEVTVVSGGSVTLDWSTTDADSCVASDGWSGTKAASGQETVYNVTVPKTFKLLCTGLGGTIAQSLFVGLALAAPVDTQKPVLALVSGVPAITSDATPSFTFNSDEAGTILYSGGCSSAITSAAVGDNTVSFGTLTSGTYDNCAIQVRDSATPSNTSVPLSIPDFIVDAIAPTGSVKIENDAPTTGSSIVTVAITCTSGDCAKMRVSGDGSINGEPIVDFAAGPTVTLVQGIGPRTVRVQLIDAAGNTAEVADDIMVVALVFSGPAPPPPPVTGALQEGFLPAPYFCVGTVIGTSSRCGDGVKGAGEICEIGEYKSVPCGAGGYKNVTCYNTGTTCDFQSVADSASACVPPSCGNGVREGGETCDDGALNGTFGHCGPDCDLNGAFYCGNFTVEGSEQCDLGAANNGQYRQSPSDSCSFDCKKPGPSCGDRLVNGTEICDGNSETSSAGCPTNTTKTRACNATCNGFESWLACGAVCGNGGEPEGDEQCDDGNANDNDACTSACRDNVCGDGFLNQGVESCDEGTDNGQECDAPYGGVCNYCTTSCQFRTKSGGYCGDNVKNGPEACDGTDVTAKTCIRIPSLEIVGGTCSNHGDCGSPFQVACATVGACNGGTRNGLACALTTDCPGGSCALPACSSSCGSSCPVAFQTMNVSIQSEIPGSSPASEIDLYSYGNENGFTPDNAALLLPACTVGTRITADVDRSNVVSPSLDVVFVTDLSASMDDGTPPNLRIDIVRQSIKAAIDDLFEGYAEAPGSPIRIGLVTYQGGEATIFEIGGESLFGPSQQSALLSEADTYNDGRTRSATPTALGLQTGLDLLGESTADVRVVILMSDGAPTGHLNKAPCDSEDCNACNNNETGDKTQEQCVAEVVGLVPDTDEIQVYSAALTDTASLIGFMAHFSSDECDQASYSSRSDCSPRDGVEYAYDGITAAEIAEMYEAITNSVLGANVGVTHTGSGETLETTGAVSAGKDVVLPFPTNFQCQGAAFSMPLTIRFTSAPESRSTIHLEDVKFEYCPTR